MAERRRSLCEAARTPMGAADLPQLVGLLMVESVPHVRLVLLFQSPHLGVPAQRVLPNGGVAGLGGGYLVTVGPPRFRRVLRLAQGQRETPWRYAEAGGVQGRA